MSQRARETETVELRVENVGGIDETTVELSPGVTILTGRNATNRTSLLQAFMAALGSDRASLKADAEEGHVELEVGETTYTRTLRRRNGRVVTDGDPYLEDATLADLFAFLLESNEARRAVARGDDLRDIIMRPVDTDEIESRISDLRDQKKDIEREIDEISSLKKDLPGLEERKSDIKEEIAKKKEQKSDIEEEIKEKDGNIDKDIRENQELDDKLDELSDVRGDLERVRHQIETQRESLEALDDEREAVEAELEEYDAVPQEKIDDLDAEIERLRERRADLDETIDRLQTVIQFNQDLLEGDLDVFADLQEGEEDVTERLLESEQDVVCWTCGSEITTGQIESMLDRFRELCTQRMEARGEIDDRISELRGDQSELEERRRQREQLRTRLEQIEEEKTEREDRLADLETRRDELIDEVETLEAAVEDRRTEEQGALVDLHKEANRVEVEIERLEADLADVNDEIERIEERLEDRERLEDQREELDAEIERLRTKIDRIERAAIEEFNDHMDTVLDVLEYDNLERIWLERTERDERQGRRTVTRTTFEMHVVRSTGDGTVYEDEIDHLSESEREVTGLVFALAGYLAHDLHEEVPFMLIDSVEAIDPARLADLVDYLTDYPEYFVAALLEDDARALDDAYQRVTDI